jgi:hypothetical protein
MPAIGATDLADIEAKAHADLEFLQQLEQTHQILPHPCLGGSDGYALWYCQLQLEKFHAGGLIDVSSLSIYRWALCIEPFCQTGNGPQTVIIEVDLLNLVTFIMAWPDATLAEIAVFIYIKGGDLYSIQRISLRLKELEITKKKASIEGYQMQEPDVQFWVWGFLESPTSPWHF